MTRTSAVQLVLVSLLGLGVGGCSLVFDAMSDKESLGAGDVVLQELTQAPGRHSWVMLPIGRVDYTVTAPTDELPFEHDTYDGAADGATLVGVGWEWDFATRPASMLDDSMEAPEPSTSLVIGDREYSLDDAMLRSRQADDDGEGGPLDHQGTAWVAVDGEPSETDISSAVIRVEYDGMTQDVPVDSRGHVDRGAASALYRVSSVSEYTVDCGSATLPSRMRAGSIEHCRADVMRVPYYQPVGWADPGDLWTVIAVRATAGTSFYDGRTYRSIDQEATVPTTIRADGHKPKRQSALPDEEWGTGSVGAVAVFLDADADTGSELSVRGAFPTTDPVGTVPVTWRFTLY